MKITIVIIFLISTLNLFAQSNSIRGEKPIYGIHLTTMNDNMLKGLLLEVKDTSVMVYPGKFKEWKKGTKYMPVEFGYSNIRELALKRKNHSRKRYFINGNRPLFNEFQKQQNETGHHHAHPVQNILSFSAVFFYYPANNGTK